MQAKDYKLFDDEQIIWTPEGNQSLENKEKVETLFDDSTSGREIAIIIEAKQVDGYSNIVTK